MSAIKALYEDIVLPKVALFRQKFDNTTLEDVSGKLWELLEAKNLVVKAGARIAITGGSRGIDQYPVLMKTIVDFVKAKGGSPFIVPAMGSHAGGIAESQTVMLNHLGISEKAMGAPIVSSMEVYEVARTEKGLPVYLDKNACDADGVILLNRIKCHTGFHGEYESGLCKMLAIGLAKAKGASFTHRLSLRHMAENIISVGRVAAKHLNVICGVGTIENGYSRVADVSVLTMDEVWTEEPKLLKKASTMMPRIWLDRMDALVIKYIGKEISGTGADPNIIGRYSMPWMKGGPEINSLGILNLTKNTGGNGIGIGFGDYTTRKVADAFDASQAYLNALTSMTSRCVFMPVVMDNDKLVFQVSVKASGKLETEENTLAIIRNTKYLEDIYLSKAAVTALAPGATVEQVGEYTEIPFDKNDNLELFEE